MKKSTVSLLVGVIGLLSVLRAHSEEITNASVISQRATALLLATQSNICAQVRLLTKSVVTAKDLKSMVLSIQAAREDLRLAGLREKLVAARKTVEAPNPKLMSLLPHLKDSDIRQMADDYENYRKFQLQKIFEQNLITLKIFESQLEKMAESVRELSEVIALVESFADPLDLAKRIRQKLGSLSLDFERIVISDDTLSAKKL